MAQREQEQRVENLEYRVATVEQILPTLATKADLTELRMVPPIICTPEELREPTS